MVKKNNDCSKECEKNIKQDSKYLQPKWCPSGLSHTQKRRLQRMRKKESMEQQAEVIPTRSTTMKQEAPAKKVPEDSLKNSTLGGQEQKKGASKECEKNIKQDSKYLQPKWCPSGLSHTQKRRLQRMRKKESMEQQAEVIPTRSTTMKQEAPAKKVPEDSLKNSTLGGKNRRRAPGLSHTQKRRLQRMRKKESMEQQAEVIPTRSTTMKQLRENWEVEFRPHRFPYKDLHRATEGFRNKNLLGVGGFGRVYKGLLPLADLDITVKKVSHNSIQGMKEFTAEVASLGRLQHRNLVRLLGYCRRKGELLLVYEYMSNGSLDKYLYDQYKRPTLSWPQRFKIIKDIASGLLYLHEEWEKVVIHRDIKASNVLLDSGMNGRLGDFGLARLYNHGTDPQSTHVVGTIGYLAPELARTSKATPLTDVFAFGTFILEVTCGRRPIFQDAIGSQIMLVDWVLEHWRGGTLADTVDANLHGDFIVSVACLVLELGLMCSHPFVNARPSMRQVEQFLSKEVPLPELRPTNMSFHMLALTTQNQGFDSYVQSNPSSSMASISTTSLAP
ncbi:L-type lectin-domain containing receptor kinase SIT2-like [Panicum virgatum]|uniref:L-type lectin-domain containing receptor kinase SIT2-like n=1 Tax=Panicum virgatum TaxID=38727 RepID=UPI0019D6484E|nr:L-type lectin-domain containing receptor kinase SIT2-like [Panicum virgatum]